MTRLEHWQIAYQSDDSDKSWTQAGAGPSLDAIARTGEPPTAPILDVGGGSSPLAGELRERGHTDITVLDL